MPRIPRYVLKVEDNPDEYYIVNLEDMTGPVRRITLITDEKNSSLSSILEVTKLETCQYCECQCVFVSVVQKVLNQLLYVSKTKLGITHNVVMFQAYFCSSKEFAVGV